MSDFIERFVGFVVEQLGVVISRSAGVGQPNPALTADNTSQAATSKSKNSRENPRKAARTNLTTLGHAKVDRRCASIM